MKAFRSVISKIMDVLFTISAVLLGASTLMTFVNSICRKILRFSFPWSEELSTYGIVISIFFTLPYLELRDEQLCINLFSSIVKKEVVLKIIFILRGLLVLTLCYFAGRYGIAAAQAAVRTNVETFVLHWPKAIFYYIAAGGFCLVLVSWITILLFNKGDKVNDC